MPRTTLNLILPAILTTVACGGAQATHLVATLPGRSTSFDFALIGDLPYSDDDVNRTVPNLVADLNRYPTLRFVVHDGDIKSSKGAACTAQLFADRHRQFKRIVAPFVLLFGDNEWRDCGNVSDPPRVHLQDQLQALALLRKEFATDAYHDDLKFRRRSPTYPEIAHWTVGHVRFVGLNVPGPDDNDRPGYESEYRPRNAANVAELKETFDEALHAPPNQEIRAIMVIFQAKPFLRRSLDDGSYQENSNLTDLLRIIKKGTRDISPRPLVLVHGESHTVTIDKPLDALGNLTRVSTFGSPFVHWIRVSVDPSDPSVFAFHLQTVPENLDPPRWRRF